MSSARLQDHRASLPELVSQKARWLATAAAASGLIALPVGMSIANKSAPFFFVLAAVLANAAALASISIADLLGRYRQILGTGLARLALALVVLALASFAWTIDRAATWRGVVEAFPEILAAGGLAAAWPVVVRRKDLALLKYGLLAALALILFEAFAGMPIHRLVGVRSEDYDLKRCVVPVVLLLWPCAEIGFGKFRAAWTLGLGAATVLAAVLAHSSASVVAIALAAAIYAGARKFARASLWVGAAFAIVLLMMAPWTGVITRQALRPGGVALLAAQHADIRVGLWSNFGQHVPERLLLGHGFDASLMVAGSPKLDHTHDLPMTWNVHPHSILLQVWVELGLIGATLAFVAIVFSVMRLARLTDRQRAFRLAFAGSAAIVALVGLNAWAPWWLAVACLCLVLFYVLRELARVILLAPGSLERAT